MKRLNLLKLNKNDFVGYKKFVMKSSGVLINVNNMIYKAIQSVKFTFLFFERLQSKPLNLVLKIRTINSIHNICHKSNFTNAFLLWIESPL